MKTDSLQTSTQNQTYATRDVSLHSDSSYQAFILDSLRFEHESKIERMRADYSVNDPALVEMLLPIISIITVFLFLWRINENKKKARIAMIDKGMDPSVLDVPPDESSRKYAALRWGLLLTGAGLGMLIGFLISSLMNLRGDHGLLVVSSFTLIFSGAGLIVYNRLTSKLAK